MICIQGYVAPQQFKVNIEKEVKTVKLLFALHNRYFVCLAFQAQWTHAPAKALFANQMTMLHETVF